MRTTRINFAAAGIAAAGVILAGGTLVARAQHGADTKGAAVPPAEKRQQSPAVKDQTEEGAAKPDAATVQKLRTELDDLLNQRAEIDRKIEAVRGKLGSNSRTHQRFEFNNGNGQPQIFEFNGAGDGNLPPEARKQLEEARKRMQEMFGNMQFNNMPMFDFQFDGNGGPNGGPDMKAFRDSMQKFRQEMHDRMQRRPNNGQAPATGNDGSKPAKPSGGGIKTLDA